MTRVRKLAVLGSIALVIAAVLCFGAVYAFRIIPSDFASSDRLVYFDRHSGPAVTYWASLPERVSLADDGRLILKFEASSLRWGSTSVPPAEITAYVDRLMRERKTDSIVLRVGPDERFGDIVEVVERLRATRTTGIVVIGSLR